MPSHKKTKLKPLKLIIIWVSSSKKMKTIICKLKNEYNKLIVLERLEIFGKVLTIFEKFSHSA